MKKYVAVALASLIILAAYVSYTLINPNNGNLCSSPIGNTYVARSLVSFSNEGPITKYYLPGGRYPNGILIARDGSVWFGEEGLPGFGHLFLNGTLFEYRWLGNYEKNKLTNSCAQKTDIWFLTSSGSKIWAGDTSLNRLVNIDTQTLKISYFQLEGDKAYPYFVTSMNNTLWFTELFGQKIGYLTQGGNAVYIDLPNGLESTPTEVYLVNSSFALYSDAGLAGTFNGGIFYFNPANATSFKRYVPLNSTGITSFTINNGILWISLHGPPYILGYFMENKTLLEFPTAQVSYSRTSLPYFVQSNGSYVWFNEHYANRISVIDVRDMTMIEQSIASVENISQIDNALTFSVSGKYVCYTALTSDSVGCLDYDKIPRVSIVTSNQSLLLERGKSATLNLGIFAARNTTFNVSYYVAGATNSSLPFVEMPSLVVSNTQFNAKITVPDSAKKGEYVVALTFYSSGTYYTKFVFLKIG